MGMAHQPGSNGQDLFVGVRAPRQQRNDRKHTKQRETDRARHGIPGRKERSPGEAAKPKDNGELDQHHTQGRHDRELISRRSVPDRDSRQLAELDQHLPVGGVPELASERALRLGYPHIRAHAPTVTSVYNIRRSSDRLNAFGWRD